MSMLDDWDHGGAILEIAIGMNETQAAAAKRLNISAAFLNQIIHGVRTPSLKLALRIEEEYNVMPRVWRLAEAGTKGSNDND